MSTPIEPVASVKAPDLGAAGAIRGSLEQQVRHGLIWSAARTWGGRFASLLVFLVLARLLQPHEFGVFAIAIAVLAFLELMSDQGLADAVVQRATLDPVDLNTAFAMNLAIACLMVGAIWVGAPWFASLMREPVLAPVLRYSSIGIVFFALGFCQVALLRRRFEYQRLAMRTVASTIGGGVVGIGMAYAGFGVWSLVGQFVVNTGIGALLLWTGPQSWTPAWRLSRKSMGELASFGSHILGTRVLEFTTNRVIELAIGFWQGAAMAGLYAVGARIYTLILQMLGSTALDVALSGFARIRHDPERLTKAYERAFELSAAVAMPLFILIAAVAPELCVAVFGPTWEPSGRVLSWLGLLGAVQVLQSYNRIGLNAMGRPDLTLALNGLSTVMTFVTLYPMRNQGLDRLVTVFVIGQIVIAPVSFAIARPYLRFSVQRLINLALPFALASGIAYAAVSFSRPYVNENFQNAMARLLGLGFVGTGAFIASIAWIAPARVRLLLQIIMRKAQGVGETGAAGSSRWTPVERRRRVIGRLLRSWRVIRPLRYTPGLYWQWWTTGYRLHHAAPVEVLARSVLIIPPVSITLIGSKGDEAMITAIVETLKNADPGRHVAMLTGGGTLPESLAALGVEAERNWAGVLELSPLVDTVRRYDSVITIGADVLDGGYAPLTALRLWLLADVAARMGKLSVVVGFSFNSRASRYLIPCLRHLDPRLRTMVRDPLSLARFERFCRRPATAVADVAFLMTPRPGNAAYRSISIWADRQRQAGRIVLGFNLSPLLVGADNVAGQARLVDAAVRALGRLIATRNVSVLLISHDYREAGIGDDTMVDAIAQGIDPALAPYVMSRPEHQHASELRALARLMDVVVAGRMHFAVAALAEGIPVGGVFYQDKFQGLFQLFNLPPLLLLDPVLAFDAGQLERWMESVVDFRGEAREQIARHLPDVLALSRRNLAPLLERGLLAPGAGASEAGHGDA